MSINKMRETAIRLAGLGWHVFPLNPREKIPLAGTRGHLDATTDPDVITAMWRDRAFANIGINCEASGLYVIDVDMDAGKGKVGRDTWTKLMAEHGHVPTFTVRTWSGGLHFYYRMPAGVSLTNTAGKSGGRGLGPDVDTRGNGFVVAPGSTVSGRNGQRGEYVVERDLPVADLPAWVIDLVAPKARSVSPGSAPSADGEFVQQRVVALAQELAAAPDGEGNDTANRVAFWSGQYVGAGQVDQDWTIATLLDGVAGWNWRSESDYLQIASTIERAVAEGVNRPKAWERPVAAHSGALVTAGVAASAAGLAAAPAAVLADPVLSDPFEVAKADIGYLEATNKLSMWSTDNGQGMYLRDSLGDILFAVGVGWMVWDGRRWKPVQSEVIQNKVSRFYRTKFEEVLARYAKDPSNPKFEALAKTFKAFMSSARLGSILNHLKVTDGVLVDTNDLDTHKELLNTPAGVVDLRNGDVSPHDRKLLLTKITSGSYRPGFKHPDWEMSLTALPEEVCAYMKLRLGQAITGFIPESDDALFLVGHGSNGKSLWTSDGVLRAIDEYGALAQATLITKSTESSAASPERHSIRGARVVLIEELPEGRALSIAEFKRIVGMSMITARNLYESQITFEANHTLFVTTNFLPPVAEVDEGSWRRFCCIQFPFRFRSLPENPEDRQGDPGLKTRLREGQQGQHDAIVTWLVEGAMLYFSDRAAIMEDRRPPSVRQATLDWRKNTDRILAFIEERITFTDSTDGPTCITRPDLYDDFCKFLTDTGHAHWALETFLSRFRAHEVIRSRQVTEGQTRNHGILSRPPLPPGVVFSSTMRQLPKVVRVFRGVIFKAEEA